MTPAAPVKVWEEPFAIPTYKVYPPEKSPLFIEKRAYQGSTGKVYPFPVTEKISDKLEEVNYQAVFLENEYLKVMILPELGGRIQRAYDKTNGYDFIYYNHVIKPALVGLTGPWISGGIEFNWPQHHRPSTYSPVDYVLSHKPDGSCTVYLSETDKMYGTKGMAAITLYPGKSYIEIKGQLYNNTDFPQSFLWWANPAVPVNDHTFSVFPPDVNAVMDHGKRAVSTFPIATGEYYKYDYSAGIDISRYKNIKVPTSYMAASSAFDFIGNYDEKVGAGLIHVADHHISPGKKQWTWGNGDFGRIWDRNLTDTDGPYIELMTGVFTDNQPDFTWMKPFEEKTFVQYFMPYKGVGRVSNATKKAVLGITETGKGKAVLKVYATGVYPDAIIRVTQNAQIIFESIINLSPADYFETAFPFTGKLTDCTVTVLWDKEVLLNYQVYKKELKPIPEPAEGMKAPQDMRSLEELYLAAVHLEQYRHAAYEPADYYREGLKRDASDIRLNNGYGLLLLKRGHIKESINYFRAAIQKQTWKNPNPKWGECYFNLGIALEADGQADEAYDAFFKSTWCAETQSSGFYWLACIAARKNEYEKALEFIEKSLVYHWHNMKARTLKAALLRKLGRMNGESLDESIAIDPLYMGCLYEKAVLEDGLSSWQHTMRDEAHNYLILSLDYGKAGFYEDALNILNACHDTNPLRQYYEGYIYHLAGNEPAAIECLEKGESCPPDYCFPSKVDEIRILQYAIDALECAPMAHYYLGNLLYDKKRYAEAAYHWKVTVLLKSDFAMAYRNLSIVFYNKQNHSGKALECIKKACQLESSYPRFWLEYDQLAGKLNIPMEERIQVMESHMTMTESRDDLYLRYITLLNNMGRYQEALSALCSRKFHPWEGGEGKVSSQYKYALIHLAIEKLEEQKPEKALSLLTDSLTYPENLGEGKLPNVPDNEIYYHMGLAYRMLCDGKAAVKAFELAASGSQEPENVLYYNDQPSDYIFYQGLAYLELNLKEAALKSFHQLITYGEKHLFDQVSYDFFAVSLPEIEVYQENIQLCHTLYCNYLRALGNLGLGDNEKALTLIKDILSKQADYQGAVSHLKYCDRLKK